VAFMSTLDLQQIARALGGEVKRDKAGSYVAAPGPGHSARDRSLSIKLDPSAPDGFVVNSFANDDPIACKDYVRERCGLPAFKPNGGTRQRASHTSIEKLMQAAINSQVRPTPQGQLVAAFDYRDAAGTLLYQVLKYDRPPSYKQRRPDGNGGWTWELDERRVLYRLAELLAYPDATVFVCEGEKDADRLAALGHSATTVAHGKWTQECITPLAGRDVIILQDNDEAGRKRALEAAQQLHETAKTLRICLLPDLPPKGDVSDWLAADFRHADKLVEICLAAPPWTAGQEAPEVTPAAEEAPIKGIAAPPVLLPFVDMAGWDNEPVPERLWAVHDRIPLRQPTLFSGEGSAGKSIITLQLCAAHVLGRDWLQTLPEPGPAIYLGAEDEVDELHRRLAAITKNYNARFTDLIAGRLHLLSYAGEDATLAVPNNGNIEPTPLFHRLLQAAASIQPKLIALDTSADVFPGNENDRVQVRQFIGLLRRLSINGNCAVVLLSHPSLTGINTGTGLSGSTGWHNSVRARMLVKAVTTDKGDEPDPDLKVLQFKKNNYGPIAQQIALRWQNGVFVPEPGAGSLEKAAADAKANNVFLDILTRFNTHDRNVNDRNGPAYAPALFAKEPEATTARISKDALADAMRRLFAANRIHIETGGRPSRPSYRLVPVSTPQESV
jgi:RecA-family ATPase